MGLIGSNKMSTKDMITLMSSLGYMLQAGITVSDGLDIIAADPDSKINKNGLQILKNGLGEGLNLSEVFKINEKVFGTGLWRQIEAAEKTGKVPSCLLRISEQFKNSGDIQSKVRGALAYPCFILAVAMFAGYYLFTNTIPEMGEAMLEFGADLPDITLLMMDICDILLEKGVLILVVLAVVVLGTAYVLTNPLRLKWHKFITTFPLSGGISISSNYARIYNLINDMVENGAHDVEALRVAASASMNSWIMHELLNCATIMEREGYSLPEALYKSTTMPSDDRLMMRVGEKTGRQMEILKDLAVRRNAEAQAAVATLLELMTPIIMVFVCGIVGVIVVAVYMPMLTIASSMA